MNENYLENQKRWEWHENNNPGKKKEFPNKYIIYCKSYNQVMICFRCALNRQIES